MPLILYRISVGSNYPVSSFFNSFSLDLNSQIWDPLAKEKNATTYVILHWVFFPFPYTADCKKRKTLQFWETSHNDTKKLLCRVKAAQHGAALKTNFTKPSQLGVYLACNWESSNKVGSPGNHVHFKMWSMSGQDLPFYKKNRKFSLSLNETMWRLAGSGNAERVIASSSWWEHLWFDGVPFWC